MNGNALKAPFPVEHGNCRVSDWVVFGVLSANSGKQPGVYSTAVGYSGGETPHATYKQVCSGTTKHTEVVLVVFDPAKISYEELYSHFFGRAITRHRGCDREMIVAANTGLQSTRRRQSKQILLSHRCMPTRNGARVPVVTATITTEIAELGDFYYAEEYHQQYLAKNPNGYCGIGGTGVSCPVGSSGHGECQNCLTSTCTSRKSTHGF